MRFIYLLICHRFSAALLDDSKSKRPSYDAIRLGYGLNFKLKKNKDNSDRNSSSYVWKSQSTLPVGFPSVMEPPTTAILRGGGGSAEVIFLLFLAFCLRLDLYSVFILLFCS